MIRFEFLFICIITIFTIAHSVSFSRDNAQSDKCKDDILSNLENWWINEMSPQKPIKCKTPKTENNFPKKLFSIFINRIPVLSYPCRKLLDESSIKFHFTGTIVDDLLTGPGKLKLSGPGLSDSNEACLTVNRILVNSLK